MSREGFNFYYTGIGLDTGVLKIFYNFDSSGNLDVLNSLSYADEQYSGQILGDTGVFYEVNGSGFFDNTAVKISNPDDLFTNECTILFTHQKSGKNAGVLLSSYDNLSDIKSGFEIGINSANKLYFEQWGANGPKIRTFSKNLSSKNGLLVNVDVNAINFGVYNFNTKLLEKESYSIESNFLFNSNEWYLGSGKNSSAYKGYIDNFVYINESIPINYAEQLFSGFFVDPIFFENSDVEVSTGISYKSGEKIGYTGVLNYDQAFSGYRTPQKLLPIYNYEILTGNLNSGDYKLEFIDYLPKYCTYESGNLFKDGDMEDAGFTDSSRFNAEPGTSLQKSTIRKKNGNQSLRANPSPSPDLISFSIDAPADIKYRFTGWIYNDSSANVLIDKGDSTQIISSAGWQMLDFIFTSNNKISFTTLSPVSTARSIYLDDLYLSKIDYRNPNQPIYSKNLVDSSQTGVTGINKIISGYEMVNLEPEPVFTGKIETGIIYTGFAYEDTTVSGSVITPPEQVSGFNLVENSGYIYSFGMNSVTYLWKREEDLSDVPEIILFSGDGVDYVYKRAQYDSVADEFRTIVSYDTGSNTTFLNGVFQFESGYSVTGAAYNKGLDLSGDYFQTGFYFFFNGFGDNKDALIFDENFPNINKVQEFQSADFTANGVLEDFPVEGQIFFNGQKLYSGIDYSGVSGFIAPNETIQSAGGIFVNLQNYSGNSYTGNYDIYDKNFPRSSTIYFLNGIRLSKNDFIEHSSEVDLITGKSKTYPENTTQLFNNPSYFWDQ